MFNNDTRSNPVDLDAIELLIAKNQQLPDPEPEGQLAVDVFETNEAITVIAAMAGTKSGDIELHLSGDVFTIRGKRTAPVNEQGNFFYRECFWGPFSRTIVLPTEVKTEHAHAEYKNGVLTVRLPKARLSGQIPIMVIEE